MKKAVLIDRKFKDRFYYQDLDESRSEIYSYYDKRFKKLYCEYAELFNIKDISFYIKDNDICNAYATQDQNLNIIAISNGYPIIINEKLKKENFDKIIMAGIINDRKLSEAYVSLEQDLNFSFYEFILDCSIQFTFSHEFQHILQFNHEDNFKVNFTFQENLQKDAFNLRRHIWEFDADRMASFEVLKFAFSYYRKLKFKSDEILECLLLVACSSMLITNCLFYFGVMNQINCKLIMNKQAFYLRKFSHPHPLVRIINIMEYFYNCVTDDFKEIDLDSQTLLNNSLYILKIYFGSILPEENAVDILVDSLITYIDDINKYNEELYEYAVNDKAIKNILLSRNISFEIEK